VRHGADAVPNAVEVEGDSDVSRAAHAALDAIHAERNRRHVAEAVGTAILLAAGVT
jgi:hypothetical protein